MRKFLSSFFPICQEFLSWNNVRLYTDWDDHVIFLLYSLYVLKYMYWFFKCYSTLKSCNKLLSHDKLSFLYNVPFNLVIFYYEYLQLHSWRYWFVVFFKNIFLDMYTTQTHTYFIILSHSKMNLRCFEHVKSVAHWLSGLLSTLV